MKPFIVFVQKEWYHIVRDKMTIAILLGLPILMLILFGYAITTEVKNTSIAIYDPSRDAATRAIVTRLQANPLFRVTGYLHNPAEIERQFKAGTVGLVVVFSEGFHAGIMHTGDAQVQLLADGTDPNTAATLTGYAATVISSCLLELRGRGPSCRIVPEVKLLYNPQMKGAYNFVPGVMGMVLMLICAMMTSVAIAREKENGTMELLLVSPLKPAVIILSKVIPYLALSLFNLGTILLLSVFLLGVPLAGNPLALFMISLLFIFVSLALGLLISSIVKTQLAALLISGMALMLPIILLSGMLFPVENMPVLLRVAADAIPARWYIIAVKKIMIKGLGFEAIIRETVILSGMAVVLILVSLKKFKTRL